MFREGVWRGFSEAIRGAEVAAAGLGGEAESIIERRNVGGLSMEGRNLIMCL